MRGKDDLLADVDACWLFANFASINHLEFDRSLFLQRYPGPLHREQWESAAGEMGMAAEFRTGAFDAVLAWRLPLAIKIRNTAVAATDEEQLGEVGDGTSWAIVLHATETHASIVTQRQSTLATVEIEALAKAYAGDALSLVLAQSSIPDPDGIELTTSKFGIRWFIPELRKHWGVWRQVLVASLVLQLMGLALPLFTQVLIDKVIVHHAESTLIALGIGLALFLVFSVLLTWIRQYLVLHTGRRIDAVLGSRIFDHLLKLPLAYFQRRPTGVIAARLQGIESIREFVASAAVTLVLDIPFLVVFVAIMFAYSVKLTLLVLGILFLLSLASIALAPVFQQRLNEQFRCGAAQQAFITENISAVETVKALQLEPQLNRRFRSILGDLLDSSFKTRQLANSYGALTSGLEQLMTTLVLLIGAWGVMTNASLTIGMLVAFQMFSSRISQPMLKMVALWQQWQQARLAVARLGDLMNAPAERYSVVPRRVQKSGAASLEMSGVNFRYDDRQPFLLDCFSLNVSAGQLAVVVGPSGSGKSTVTKLLQGFCTPTAGSIRVGGVDHAHMSANELRANYGVVLQETVLFSGSLLENLKLANPFATLEQVVAACQMADLHSTIEHLPDGYQTVLGERGTGLSGGQRQRLAIARALLRGPRVLLFDEATSNLDQVTAEQVARTINALRGKVTIVFITHQVPKGLLADQVIRLGEKVSIVPSTRMESGAK